MGIQIEYNSIEAWNSIIYSGNDKSVVCISEVSPADGNSWRGKSEIIKFYILTLKTSCFKNNIRVTVW